MKKLLLILLVVSAIFLLIACGTSIPEDSPEYTVAQEAIYPDTCFENNQFWNHHTQRGTIVLDQLEPLEVVVNTPPLIYGSNQIEAIVEYKGVQLEEPIVLRNSGIAITIGKNTLTIIPCHNGVAYRLIEGE